MLEGADVLKVDHFGVKVARIADNRILKLFRTRKKLSSALWSPYALRFVRHAEILRRRMIRTISIERIFIVGEVAEQGVVYEQLEGETLRTLLEQEVKREQRDALIAKLACFLAELHGKGILFRSNHFGNIVVTPEGAYALIDIVDLRVRRWGQLNLWQRVRNLQHLTRYPSDKVWIDQFSWDKFLSLYTENYKCNGLKRWLFLKSLQKLNP